MKRTTNRYRRCPNCPHHKVTEQKCCCQRNSPSKKVRAMTSRHKREPSTIDQSSVMNTTTIPTIIAQFSALRNQNNHLKRQLLNVSTFLKDENFHNQSVTETPLNEKLFLANKNLKEALLQIDSLSRANKQLCDKNSKLIEQSEGQRLQLRQAQDYLQKYKKKCRKLTKDHQYLASKEEIQKILQRNAQLQQEVQELKEQIRCLRFQNQNYNMVGGLSPQWVAHTGIKGRQLDITMKHEEEIPKEDVLLWKKGISETINLLRNEGSHLSSNLFSSQNVTGIDDLTQQFISSYSQSILTHFQLLMKQMNRKLNNFQKKMNNLASKLQNFIIVFKNKKLKKKMFPPLTLVKTERIPMMDVTNRVL